MRESLDGRNHTREGNVDKQVTLNEILWCQVTAGLECRAEAWENTARYLRDETYDLDGSIEECHDPEEADAIAETYRTIIEQIREQIREQTFPEQT